MRIISMNFKNQLQELCQKRGFSIPKYDLVENSGQSHCPVVVVRVTVNWDGEQLVEEARGEGMKRKDVEKKAAQQMYQRIYDTKLSSTRPTVPQPVPPQYPAVRSPSASVKNELQELLQKSVYNLPPPLYEEVPSPRKGEFTSKITILNNRDQVLAQEYGYGKTKKESETDAARKMKPIMQKKLESGNLSVIEPSHSPTLQPREVIDHELDSNIDDRLLEFSPRYDLKIGVDKTVLCLARASCGVAAQGMGEDEQTAMRDAKLNLLQYLGFLK